MIRLVFLLLLGTSFQFVHAQLTPKAPTTPPPQDSMKTLEMLHADTYGYKRVDSVTEIQTWVGKVRFKQEQTLFDCDSAIYNRNRRVIEAFGNIHINDHDSVNIYSKYLLYHVDTKIAILKNTVQLTDGKTTLLTEELQYDLNQKIGEYTNGGKVLNEKSVLTSKEGTYYADLKDVYFKKNVVLVDPSYTLTSDSLLYNTNSQVATFITLTNIVDSLRRRIVTREGFYDLKRRRSFLAGRSTIVDSAVFVTADKIETDDSSGITILRGNAVYKDTAQGVAILSNQIEANRGESSFIATQHPLMIIRQDNDSIYLTADTLLSGRLSTFRRVQDSLRRIDSAARAIEAKKPKIRDTAIAQTTDTASRRTPIVQIPSDTTGAATVAPTTGGMPIAQAPRDTTGALTVAPKIADTNSIDETDTIRRTVIINPSSAAGDSADRYFRAWYHVRIFSDSLQAVSDSLFYGGDDSVFRLFKDPVMWASGNQVTGDTIFLYTKNKKADRLRVFENGMAINKAAENMFNQIKGTRLTGYFRDGVIDYMRARGNAESVYYVKDDNEALVGMNRASGNIIDMRFKDKALDRVVFINDVKGTLFPLRQIAEEDKRLRNFKWLEDRRPKSKFELFGN